MLSRPHLMSNSSFFEEGVDSFICKISLFSTNKMNIYAHQINMSISSKFVITYIRNSQSLQVSNEIWQSQDPCSLKSPLNSLWQVCNTMPQSAEGHVWRYMIEQKANVSEEEGCMWHLQREKRIWEACQSHRQMGFSFCGRGGGVLGWGLVVGIGGGWEATIAHQ